jgi:hypothetical protein
MNNKNRKILSAIFSDPLSANIAWADIEALFNALGAKISEREGSRVMIELNQIKFLLHRPHPRP